MNTQTLKCPLTQSLPDLQCGHNSFTHRVFPRLILAEGRTTLDYIAMSPETAADMLESAINLTNEMCPRHQDETCLLLRDISITNHQIDDYQLTVIALSKPQETINAHFIGLLSRADHADEAVRYLTLERSSPRKAVLCEWVCDEGGNLTHRLLLTNCKTNQAAFIEAIKPTLSLYAFK